MSSVPGMNEESKLAVTVMRNKKVMSGKDLLHKLRWLIVFTWIIPAVFGIGFILMIGVLQPSQMLVILTSPLQPAYDLIWLAFIAWFLPWKVQPLADWLDNKPGCSAESAQLAVRRFPFFFWVTFLLYLVMAPASVIWAAELYTGFVATPYDWFRIELVALITSIIVGLPIFFLIFDMFGRALGASKLSRPILTIRTKVFLIGALVPLLIDTMLVQYYWTRTGYFSLETFGVWLLLEALAIGGSIIFAHSFGQSLSPLQILIATAHPLPAASISGLQARSTDEIGVLTSDYRVLLEKQWLQGEMQELNNSLLRSAGSDVGTAAVLRKIVELCCQATHTEQAFVLVYDKIANELVGVIQSGSDYRPEGHYRFRLDETALSVWIFNQRQTVAIDDVARDPRINRHIVELFNVHSAIGTPLRLDEERIGVLMAVTHDGPRHYSAFDISMIEGLAREAASALNAQQLREARAKAEKSHLEQQEMFGLILNSTAEGIYGVDMQGVCTFVNPACLSMLGYEKSEDLIGKPMHALIHHSYADGKPYPMAACAVLLSTREGKQAHADNEIHWRADGSSFPVEFWSRPIYRNDQIEGAVVTFVDITKRKQVEGRLQLTANVFTHAREGILITDTKGNIVEINDTFSRITGYSREEVLGQNPRMLRSGRQSAEFYVAMWKALLENGYWSGEMWNRRKNGEDYAELISISAVHDKDGKIISYLSLFTDITEMKEHQQQLEHIAHYDALTSMPNRVLLADRLQQGMAQSLRNSQGLAVTYLDLDGFKAVNDAHGHNVGDQLLIALAQRMKSALREGDTLARIGGDEFVAVLVNLESPQDYKQVLQRLLQAAADPVTVGGIVLQVSATIGVTLYPQDNTDADHLLRHADQAMYQAKLAGKNRYHLFDVSHDAAVQTQRESLAHIRHGIDQHEFVLHYQPKVNMKTGVVVGAEALIRWQHPERHLLSPAAFLPIIENHPFSVELGEWVIDTALSQMSEWHAQGLDIPLSVNIAAYQLQHDDFVTRLTALLAAHPDIKPSCLELEVLETSALEDVARVSGIMHACREMGVRFALDDFGTGYSSLTYLKRLPADMLKIDQSFVRDMLDDQDDLAIVKGVIGLASAFRRTVIAEGVETTAHGVLLLSLGCDLAQGFVIAHPMPASELLNWVDTWRPHSSWTGNISI